MSFEAYSATSLSASQTVANIQHVRLGHILPKGGAALAETNGTYDLGSSSYVWNKAYIDSVASTLTVSAPATFTGQAIFATMSTFANGVFPQRVSIEYTLPVDTLVAYVTGTAFILEWNTVTANYITGATLTTNQLTLPSGTYVAHMRTPGFAVATAPPLVAALYLFDVTSSLTVADICSMNHQTDVVYGNNIAYFSLATQSALEVRLDSTAETRWSPMAPGIWEDGQFKNTLSRMTIFKVS